MKPNDGGWQGDELKIHLAGHIAGALGAACDVAPKLEQSDIAAILGNCVAMCGQMLPDPKEKVLVWVLSIVNNILEQIKADPSPNAKKLVRLLTTMPSNPFEGQWRPRK